MTTEPANLAGDRAEAELVARMWLVPCPDCDRLCRPDDLEPKYDPWWLPNPPYICPECIDAQGHRYWTERQT